MTTMGLDIRLPLGLLFVTLGGLLALFGALSDPAIYARSLGINVNLVWGIVMFLFGGVLLWLSRRRRVSAPMSSRAAAARESSRAGL